MAGKPRAWFDRATRARSAEPSRRSTLPNERRGATITALAATSGGTCEILNPSDDGYCCNFRGHMPRCCDHRVYLAEQHYGSDRSSRREGIRLVLDLSRERGNRSWIAGVVGGTKPQGRRRCLISRSTRTPRRRCG